MLLLLVGCLFDRETYERRLLELSDADGDGYPFKDDCDDENSGVHPGASERCDEADEDCDGRIDEDAEDAPSWFPDADADGFGEMSATPVRACSAPPGHAANALDCDDAATAVSPAATEVPYDGVDDDCDGADLTDVDGDGEAAVAAGGTDCDDHTAAIHAGAEDTPYDGQDQDCSGSDANDLDGDGAVAVEAGGGDCDDDDPTILPDALEAWADGFTDNDCDGISPPVLLEFGGQAWLGASPGGQAGRRIGSMGDLTGDGRAEVLIGAPYDGTAFSNGGMLYVVDGARPWGSVEGAMSVVPSESDWYLPQVAEGLPDVDGDGRPDLLVTTTGYADWAGAAFVVSGAKLEAAGTLRLPGDATRVLAGEAPGDLAGVGAAYVGDVMGDGGRYLAISALMASSSDAVHAGELSIFDAEGSGAYTLADAELSVWGPYAEAEVGNTIGAAGDQDEDGIDDLLVTVNYGDVAYIVPGGMVEPLLPDDALFRLTGSDSATRADAEMIGDIDGDGRRDLACVTAETEVRLFTALSADGVRDLAEPSATFTVPESGRIYDVLDLGDLDEDGLAETLLPEQWDPDWATSILAILPGDRVTYRASLALGDLDLTAASLRPDARFGYRVALSEDVDGDARPDILVGGYSDGEGGAEAGAVTTIPVPR